MREKPAIVIVLIAVVLAAGPEASAHRMMAAARVQEDGTALLQAFFPDGKPARGVRVEVRRPDGSLFLEGQTDEGGKLTITPDDIPGRWTATFIGSTGHSTETSFEVGPPPAVPEAFGAEGEESLIRKEPFPWLSCLAGLGFIFGLSALLMCLKLRADVRRMRQERQPNSD